MLALTAVNYRGVTRTARPDPRTSSPSCWRRSPSWWPRAGAAGAPDPARLGLADADGGVYGTLQAAGLLFFAFAGYARIATMGEEVRDPARTIPRAIVIALAVAVAVYAVVAVTVLAVLGAGASPPPPRPSPTRDGHPLGSGGDTRGRRRRGRGAGRAARAHRRDRPHHARHGPRGRPAAPPGGGASDAIRCPTTPTSRSAPW